jgi:hypothetical protein
VKRRKNNGYPSYYGKNIAQNAQRRWLKKKKEEQEKETKGSKKEKESDNMP